jgi:hypothetical protein
MYVEKAASPSTIVKNLVKEENLSTTMVINVYNI